MKNSLNELIHSGIAEIINIRQQLHQIPELKFEEFKTSALITEKLQSYGCENITKFAKTGIVTVIDSGKPGKTVALRADIDALPIQEETGITYQSRHSNRMHACGHDGHTATLLLVAQVLQKMKEEFCGKVKLIFQPAEEGGKGSLAMINEGVLEAPKVDAIFGYHNWPGLTLGKVGTRIGSILMGAGRFEITVHGRVAHTSRPQNAINPVIIGAKIVTALEELRHHYRMSNSIINVIRFESGDIKGGMTDTVKITGVYYIENNEMLTTLKSDIEKKAYSIAKANNATITPNFFEFHTATINSEKESNLVLNTARKLLANQNVVEFSSCQIAAEDFSEYLRKIPGCFFLVGSGENSPPVHTAKFDFPDEIISVAAKMMCQTAVNFLN